LEPLRWDGGLADRSQLGAAVGLVTNCLEAEVFWTGLKNAHTRLKERYRVEPAAAAGTEQELGEI